MLAEERLKIISDFVNDRGSATITDLTTITSSSESTTRRDLNYLSREGKIFKVHGGAVSKKLDTKDEQVDKRRDKYAEEKEKIATYASTLIAVSYTHLTLPTNREV